MMEGRVGPCPSRSSWPRSGNVTPRPCDAGSPFQQRRHRPAPPPPTPTVFSVVLERQRQQCRCAGDHLSKAALENLIAGCPVRPKVRTTPSSGHTAAKLFFPAWLDALEAVVYLWGRRLEGAHEMNVTVLSNSPTDACDRAEEAARLRDLFAQHARGLLYCESAKRCGREIEAVTDEIGKLSASMKSKTRLAVFQERQARRNRFEEERSQLMQKQREFQVGLISILGLLDEKEEDGDRSGKEEGDTLEMFQSDEDLDWNQIHSLLIRERRRLDDGLPIFAYRTKILSAINSNQVVILVGETGSGKSTQIVQFLADEQLDGCGTIICTQPRKIAATSLAKRVSEESRGCYQDDLSSSYLTYFPAHTFKSRVVFTTDHCFLQHLMNDPSLTGISHVIIDEAHERSLNTDLILALLKSLLYHRPDLRLIIMSATADVDQLSSYFYDCLKLFVTGQSFPVEVKYVDDVSAAISTATAAAAANTKQVSCGMADYAVDVVKMASLIHQTEEEGAILAFLTSQMEVEWACEQFESSSATVLPLHGKLLPEEQQRVFMSFPGKRKVIFSTNIAETSLTIPGIKYVVDSGMVKESRFDAGCRMNVLRVCQISQSSAKQRAGRAGRTAAGKCYRIYSETDFQSMAVHQEPEICKVHLGIAVLRIISMGVKNVEQFDFVNAPDPKSIDAAVQNLVQLGAVVCREGRLELTETGQCLTKLGVEPRLGKMILDCHAHGLTKEGLVLAAVMANASSLFCRVGGAEEKQRADCLKIPFCHHDGDLFTLLSVYREWERVQESRNAWCWQHSINAKAMRRCAETVGELDACLYNELNIIVPTYWKWENQGAQEYCRLLKKVILRSLADNVAIFSGSERLGYEIASSGLQLPLHPSSSLLIYGKMPSWVVFGEILSMAKQYLVCVTAVDADELFSMQPPPPFDPSRLMGKIMKQSVIIGVSRTVLRRLYGRGGSNLFSLCARVQRACGDDRIRIELNFEGGAIQVLAAPADIDKANAEVNDALDCQTRLLRSECMEKSLFRSTAAGVPTPTALFGAGAEIRHLELDGRRLAVEISHPEAKSLGELEILMAIDRHVSGVAAVYRHVDDLSKWGKLVFLSPDDADTAVSVLNGMELHNSCLKVSTVQSKSAVFSGDGAAFPAVTAKIFWPRKPCKGSAMVRCAAGEAALLAKDLDGVVIGGRVSRSEVSLKFADCVILGGLSEDASEEEILDVLATATARRITSVRLARWKPVEQLPAKALEEAILREMALFISGKKVRVQVFEPETAEQPLTRALISFDGSLHVEAAQALSHLSGRALPCCQPWQKMHCQRTFRSSLIFPAYIYRAVRTQLLSLVQRFNRLRETQVILEEMEGSRYRLKMAANGTKTIADLRRPLEDLVKGKVVAHPELTPAVARLICSRDGAAEARSLEHQLGAHIIYDKRTGGIRIFGPPENIAAAEQQLVECLLSLHEKGQLTLCLRGGDLPADVLKQLVDRFGPDLRGLEENVPGATFLLDTRRHVLHIRGRKEHRRKVEIILSGGGGGAAAADNCPICLCALDEPYELQGCGHWFCRSCLVEQMESAIRAREGFPLCCLAMEGSCRAPILLVDLRLLLSAGKLEELFWAALAAHVAGSGGAYRFCPSPDCPGVYRVAAEENAAALYACGACSAEICTGCHLEYHPWVSCQRYKEIKDDPDVSLEEWRRGKTNVKNCPTCGHAIEKTDGCSHVECRCGCHICWDCLLTFSSGEECYSHLRASHPAAM